MNRTTQLIVTALIFTVVGAGLALWLGGGPATDYTVTKTSAECWEVTVDRGSTNKYFIVIKATGKKMQVAAGETVEVCEPFDFYHNIPIDPDPDDE